MKSALFWTYLLLGTTVCCGYGLAAHRGYRMLAPGVGMGVGVGSSGGHFGRSFGGSWGGGK